MDNGKETMQKSVPAGGMAAKWSSLAPGSRKKIIIAGAAGGAAAVAVIAALLWLAHTPGFALKGANSAKLTPVECSVYVAAPDLKRNIRYISKKEPAQAFAKKGVPKEFQRITFGPEINRVSKKLGVKITPARLLDMSARDIGFARFEKKDKADPSDFLMITKLGFRQRVAANLGMRKLPAAGTSGKHVIRSYGAANRKLFVSLGGGYLLVSDSEKAMRDALALGAKINSESVASQDLYVRAKKLAPKGGRTVLEWYSPGGNIKSALTNAKINYGEMQYGGGGATIFFVSKAASTAPAAPPAVQKTANPAFLLPDSVSLFVTTRAFGRLWEDLLLGKAMPSEDAETFLQQLYGMGLDKLGLLFEGNAVTALDGIIKLADSTPVPNLIFLYMAKNDRAAFKAADVIFRKTIKETYLRVPGKYLDVPYVSFAPETSGSSLSPSFAVVRGYLVFTLTADELKKVIRVSTGGAPALSSQKYFKDLASGAAPVDALILLDGKRLASDTTGFFSAFSEISSRPLAEAINKLVVPSAGLLSYAEHGAGSLNYKGDLLVGDLRLQRGADEEKTKGKK